MRISILLLLYFLFLFSLSSSSSSSYTIPASSSSLLLLSPLLSSSTSSILYLSSSSRIENGTILFNNHQIYIKGAKDPKNEGADQGWEDGVLMIGSLLVEMETSNVTFEGFKWKGDGNSLEIIGVSKARLAIKGYNLMNPIISGSFESLLIMNSSMSSLRCLSGAVLFLSSSSFLLSSSFFRNITGESGLILSIEKYGIVVNSSFMDNNLTNGMRIGEWKVEGGGGGGGGGWEGEWEEEVGGLDAGWREGGGGYVGNWEDGKSTRLLNEKIDNIHEHIIKIIDNWEEKEEVDMNGGGGGGGGRKGGRGGRKGGGKEVGRGEEDEGRILNELAESPQILIRNLNWEGGLGGGLELTGGGGRRMEGGRMEGGIGGVRMLISGGGWLKIIKGEFKNNNGGVVKVTGEARIRIEGVYFEGNGIEEKEGIGGPCVNVGNAGSILILISNVFKLNFAFFQSNCIYFSVKLSSSLSLLCLQANLSQDTFLQNRGFNGLGISGGGGQRIQLVNCLFGDNWVGYGGGGLNLDETGTEREVIVQTTVFKGNYADNYAGAVFIYGAGATEGNVVVFENCLFEESTAVWEGGAFSIWLYYPKYYIYFNNCTFNNSKLVGSGNSVMGACLDYWGDTSWIKEEIISFLKTKNCRFLNSFSFSGSAVYMVAAYYYDYGTVYLDNFAEREGGSILISDSSQIFLNMSQIIRSRAAFSGGGLGGKEEVKIYLHNVLFLECSSKSGVGIYIDGNSEIFADNVTFIENTGELGSAILLRNSPSSFSFLRSAVFDGNKGSYSTIQLEYSALQLNNTQLSNSAITSLSAYSSTIKIFSIGMRNLSCPDSLPGCGLFFSDSSAEINQILVNLVYPTAIYLQNSLLSLSNASSTSVHTFLKVQKGDIQLTNLTLHDFVNGIVGSEMIIDLLDIGAVNTVKRRMVGRREEEEEEEEEEERRRVGRRMVGIETEGGSFLDCADCGVLVGRNVRMEGVGGGEKGGGMKILRGGGFFLENISFFNCFAKEEGGAVYLEGPFEVMGENRLLKESGDGKDEGRRSRRDEIIEDFLKKNGNSEKTGGLSEEKEGKRGLSVVKSGKTKEKMVKERAKSELLNGNRLLAEEGKGIFKNCIFQGNKAKNGGGIFVLNAPIRFEGGKMQFNEAQEDGGGLKWVGKRIEGLETVEKSGNKAVYGADEASFPIRLGMTRKKKEGTSDNEGRRILMEENVLEVLWDSKRDGGEGRILNAGSGGIIPDDLVFYFLDEKGEIIRTIKDDYLKIEFLDNAEGGRRISEKEMLGKDRKLIRKSKETIDFSQKNDKKRTLTTSDDLIYSGTRRLLLGQTFQTIDPATSQFVITDLTVIGRPRSIIYLKMSVVKTKVEWTGGKKGNDWDIEGGYFFVAGVEMRSCLEGEVYVREENECRTCPVGKYSFYPVNSSLLPSICLPCPPNAFCPGGSSIELYPNYWRSSNTSDKIYLCNLNSEGCTGGRGGTKLGLFRGCKGGYEGNLCEMCEGEKSKNYLDRCEECSEVGAIVVYVLVLVAALVGGGVLIIKVFWRVGESQKKEESGKLTRKRRLFILKVLIIYLNMVFLSKCFNAWIWEWVRAVYGVFEAGSLIIRNMVDSSCLLKKMKITENNQFSNLITGNVLGYALILVATVYIRRRYGLERSKVGSVRNKTAKVEGEGGEASIGKRGNLKGLRKKMIEGMMTLCFVFKGSLLFLGLDVFNCVEIEGISYLESSPNYQCLTESHIFVIVFFSIPLIFVLMLVAPLFLIFLIQMKKEVHNFIKEEKTEVKLTIGEASLRLQKEKESKSKGKADLNIIEKKVQIKEPEKEVYEKASEKITEKIENSIENDIAERKETGKKAKNEQEPSPYSTPKKIAPKAKENKKKMGREKGLPRILCLGVMERNKLYFEVFVYLGQCALILVLTLLDKNQILKPISGFLICLSMSQAVWIIKPYKYKIFNKLMALAFIAAATLYLSIIFFYNENTPEQTKNGFVFLALLINWLFFLSCGWSFFHLKEQKTIVVMKRESLMDDDYDTRFEASSIRRNESSSISMKKNDVKIYPAKK